VLRVLPLLALAACDPSTVRVPPEAVPAEQKGPYAVGATTREFTDARGVSMTIEVWYPAAPEPGANPTGYGVLSVVRDAYRDAPPDRRGAPYPLVAFSHGYGGIRYQSTFLTEHLASHGFVVVAPDHPHNTFQDLDADRTAEVALARPGDVSAAVDAVLGAPLGDPLYRLAADDGFAMVGHSFGAWTSLVIGGGALDVEASVAHCADDRTAACNFFDLTGIQDVSAAAPDPRAVTVVAMATGGWFTFGATGLYDIVDPLLFGGRLDEDMPYDSEIRPTMDAIGTAKRLVTYERTGHWSFTDLCDVGDFLPDCAGESSGYTEPLAIQAWTNTLVTAHVRSAFDPHPTDAAWLDEPAWADQPDVTWESVP